MVSTAYEVDEFLGENYEVPESGGGGKYLKLKEGTTHFRVLSRKALKGWEYWTVEGKPKRVLTKPNSTPNDIRIGDDGKPDRVKHFWAMTVWDYSDKSVKVLSVTQSTIQKAITALVKDADFGHPTQYDLKVSRSGSGIETEYNVMPLHKLMPPEAIAALEKTPVYLDALMHNADPFSPDSSVYVAEPAPAASKAKPQFVEGEDLEELLSAAKVNGWNPTTLKLALADMQIAGNKKIPHDRADEVMKFIKDQANVAIYKENAAKEEEKIAQGGIPF